MYVCVCVWFLTFKFSVFRSAVVLVAASPLCPRALWAPSPSVLEASVAFVLRTAGLCPVSQLLTADFLVEGAAPLLLGSLCAVAHVLPSSPPFSSFLSLLWPSISPWIFSFLEKGLTFVDISSRLKHFLGLVETS